MQSYPGTLLGVSMAVQTMPIIAVRKAESTEQHDFPSLMSKESQSKENVPSAIVAIH